MPVQALVLKIFQQFVVFECYYILTFIFFGLIYLLFVEVKFLLIHLNVECLFNIGIKHWFANSLGVFHKILMYPQIHLQTLP